MCQMDQGINKIGKHKRGKNKVTRQKKTHKSISKWYKSISMFHIYYEYN